MKCTDKERQAFKEKMKWNGMTVNRPGKIKDFLKDTETYIEATPLRLEGINGDFRYTIAVSNELASGLYFEGGAQ